MRNYVVGQDKCLVRNDSPLVAGWEECHDLKTLMTAAPGPLGECVKEGLSFVANKLPAELFKKIVATAGRFPHQETGFVLRYNIWKKEWQVRVPEKFYGGGASVDMTSEVTTDGFADIGTVHTHPGMSAHWSGVDLHDQHAHPGIHILLGLDKGKVAETLCSIFTRYNQYDVDLWSVCEKIDLRGEYEADEEWVKNLTYKPHVLPPLPEFAWPAGRTKAPRRCEAVPGPLDKRDPYGLGMPDWYREYFWPTQYPDHSVVDTPESPLTEDTDSQAELEARVLAEYKGAEECISALEDLETFDNMDDADELIGQLFNHVCALVRQACGKDPDDLIREENLEE